MAMSSIRFIIHRLRDLIFIWPATVNGCGIVFVFATVQNPGADRSSLIIGCGPSPKSDIGVQIVFGPSEGPKNAHVFGALRNLLSRAPLRT